MGAGGAHTGLQQARRQPAGQPLELAVAQEAVALDEAGNGAGVSAPAEINRPEVLKREEDSQAFEVLHSTEGIRLDGADGVASQVSVGREIIVTIPNMEETVTFCVCVCVSRLNVHDSLLNGFRLLSLGLAGHHRCGILTGVPGSPGPKRLF